MFFLAVGVLLLLSAVFGPALGLNMRIGGPGARVPGKTTLGARLVTAAAGTALIVAGIMEVLEK